MNYEYASTLPVWMKDMIAERYTLNEEGEVCMSRNHPSVLSEHRIGKSNAVYEAGYLIKGELIRCFEDEVVSTVPTKEVAKLLSPEF